MDLCWVVVVAHVTAVADESLGVLLHPVSERIEPRRDHGRRGKSREVGRLCGVSVGVAFVDRTLELAVPEEAQIRLGKHDARVLLYGRLFLVDADGG